MPRTAMAEQTRPRSAAVVRAGAVLVPAGPVERALLAVAAVFAGVGALHLIPFFATGGVWEGAMSWRKPIVFGLSIGIVTWWLAWVLQHIAWPARRKRSWAIGYTAAMVVEYAVITGQQWRGVPSHFNGTSPLDGGLFVTMGIAIGIVSALIVVLAVAAVRQPPPDPALRWAVLGGLALMIAGLAVGGLLIQMGFDQRVDGVAPEVVRAGAAGAPKYIHAVALHTPQALVGLLALVHAAGLPRATRTSALRFGVATCSAFVVAAGAHTLAGRALLDVMNPTGVLLIVTLVGCALPFAPAMMALWRDNDTTHPPQRDTSPTRATRE